ncbi:MAG TPA: WYL domain-containing protein [Gemmatimonadaceae bacterium]
MSIDAGERLQRFLRLMPLVVDKGDVPFTHVESMAGMDALTLLDDLRALTERDDEPPPGHVEAVRIFFEPDSVSVESPHFARPIRITLPELCALELGLAILGASVSASERDVIDRARARVRRAIVSMPETEARNDLWYASGPRTPNEKTLEVLRSSAATATKAQIVYRRGDSSESTERIVHPYAVLPVRGAWFLVAHCERAGGTRFFRVDRVQSAKKLDQAFAPTDVILSEAKDLLLGGERALSASVADRLVVRYSPRIARWIAEREEGESGEDGSFVVSHPLADDAWAVRHVLQYGSEAEVLAPSRIRERLAETLRQMLRITS